MKTNATDFAFNDTATRLAQSSEDGIRASNPPLTKREYFAANSGITWKDAAINCDAKLGRTSTVKEVADYFSAMKIVAADALITALNKTK